MDIDIIGWDIGGAHIKAAALDQNGSVVRVIQRDCPLWKSLSQLNESLKWISSELNGSNARHAVTMTGELVDIFEDRREGVLAILDAVDQQLSPATVSVFAGRHGFLSINEVSEKNYEAVASANWLASGLWVAQQTESALFADIGTTTTDLILIENNQVKVRGYTDYDRMRYDELVYTGIARTPVMAIVDRVPFEGESVGIMAEHFATMADVYRITGELPEYADQLPACDNGEKTINGSIRRLARMIGRDLNSVDRSKWRRLGRWLRERQIMKIRSACEKQFSRNNVDIQSIVGVGVGRFLLKDLAARFRVPYIDFGSLFTYKNTSDCFGPADCAPVVSVAGLLKQSWRP